MVSVPDPLESIVRAVVEWFDVAGFSEWWNATGWQWTVALLILVGGWYLSRVVVHLLGRQVARRFQRPSITKTVLRGIRTSVLVIAVLAAAATIGIRGSDLLLSVGVFSAVLGLVLAPIIGSAINGLFVLADQPYEIGDMIELADGPNRGTRGFVEDITIRYTKIFTLDNTFLVVPNATMRERDVINYSAEDERSRLSYEVSVTYEGDLEEARGLVERAAREVPDVITGGPDIRIGSARYSAAPVARIKEFGDHGVRLELRYWVKNPYKIPNVQSALQENIWEQLPEADVTVPYPHSHVIFDETSGRARVDVEEWSGDQANGDGDVR